MYCTALHSAFCPAIGTASVGAKAHALGCPGLPCLERTLVSCCFARLAARCGALRRPGRQADRPLLALRRAPLPPPCPGPPVLDHSPGTRNGTLEVLPFSASGLSVCLPACLSLLRDSLTCSASHRSAAQRSAARAAWAQQPEAKQSQGLITQSAHANQAASGGCLSSVQRAPGNACSISTPLAPRDSPGPCRFHGLERPSMTRSARIATAQLLQWRRA